VQAINLDPRDTVLALICLQGDAKAKGGRAPFISVPAEKNGPLWALKVFLLLTTAAMAGVAFHACGIA
jgi:hypothetical protein